jgi:chromosome partitioning protein
VILAVANIKGGVGKTTLSVNLAVARAMGGSRLLLVDADEQGSATDFTQNRRDRVGAAGYELLQLAGAESIGGVAKLSKNYDDVVIDLGGQETGSLSAALAIADTVLIPIQPGNFDVWALDRMATLITAARVTNPNVRALAMINAADASGQDNQEAIDLIKSIEGVTTLEIRIVRRKAYRNAVAQGRSVLDVRPRDPKASQELMALMLTLWPSGRAKR